MHSSWDCEGLAEPGPVSAKDEARRTGRKWPTSVERSLDANVESQEEGPDSMKRAVIQPGSGHD
jgi:hypothetical protein